MDHATLDIHVSKVDEAFKLSYVSMELYQKLILYGMSLVMCQVLATLYIDTHYRRLELDKNT
jgi:hypothetical protein